MNTKQVEKRALIVSTVINLVMAVAGIMVFLSTQIQALFLDGIFSLIAAVSSVTAVCISRMSIRPTKRFLQGPHFLEPLYALCKSALTLILLVSSIIAVTETAWLYFAEGIGSPMNVGPVLPYAILMGVLCFGLGIFNRAQNARIHHVSTMLAAESRSNFVDGMLSLGVGAATLLLQFADINGPLGFLHYTGDFFITVALVILALPAPVRVLRLAIRELRGMPTDDPEVVEHIRSEIDKHMGSVADCVHWKAIKTGMWLTLCMDYDAAKTGSLARERSELRNSLQRAYHHVDLQVRAGV